MDRMFHFSLIKTRVIGFLGIHDALQIYSPELLYDVGPITCHVFPGDLFASLDRRLNGVTDSRHGRNQPFERPSLLEIVLI